MIAPRQAEARAVVFAYHDMGVRCLEALLELGVEISLLVTHTDSPAEKIWFSSVADVAKKHGIPVISPKNPNCKEVIEQVSQCHPDFIFSFYYRRMLAQDLLNIPAKGAYNMHGSLLPRYRGRVPVNWAIIHGEKKTGVSLHSMNGKPDAGDLVAQRTVDILCNDTAFELFQKLKYAAEFLLMEVVPELIAGKITAHPMDLSRGSYYSGRQPEDGLIDWTQPAWDIHNLIRAVAPPYPGAFFTANTHRLEVLGSYFRDEQAMFSEPCLYFENGDIFADCIDGTRFMVTRLMIDQCEANSALFQELFGHRLLLSTVKQS